MEKKKSVPPNPKHFNIQIGKIKKDYKSGYADNNYTYKIYFLIHFGFFASSGNNLRHYHNTIASYSLPVLSFSKKTILTASDTLSRLNIL